MREQAKRRVHSAAERCTWLRRKRDYQPAMQFLTSRAVHACVLAGALVGCATSTPKPSFASSPAGEMAMPAPSSAARTEALRPDRDDDLPLPPRAHVNVAACEPEGKSVVVSERDASGRPMRWRYFATRRGRRLLTCEAVDANGDGRVDARYFYGAGGHLVLEQRDLDFDGHAEVEADYSQFQPHRRVAHAGALVHRK
jgi:hypothetical protein